MKRLTILIIAIVLLAGFVACASSREASAPSMGTAPSYPEDMPAPAPAEKFEVFSKPTITAVPSPTRVAGSDSSSTAFADISQYPLDADRMIVRTGNIYLVVEDVVIAIDRITTFTDEFEGYVVSSRSWKEGERLIGDITIRVPAERYTDAVDALRDMAVEVISESSSSQDVTEEYVDLQAKLRNLEASEEQLLKLMEKATKVEEILSVQQELSKTRGEIEQTKGRMEYLERTSATSLIEIHLEQSRLDVKFNADRRFVKSGEKVYFYPEIAGGFPPYSYEWDFGDGNTSNDISPVHKYKIPGDYTVSLKVTDDKDNVDSETAEDYIVVLSGWDAGNTASSAWSGFITFVRALANVFIWIGIFSPLWIVIGFLVYWFWWRRRKIK